MRLFIDEDAYGDLCVWEHLPQRPSAPQVVLRRADVRDDALWARIERLVEEGTL